jgi:hypothetical protein
MFYFMESATIIIFFPTLALLGAVKKSTLCTLVIMIKKMDGPLIEYRQNDGRHLIRHKPCFERGIVTDGRHLIRHKPCFERGIVTDQPWFIPGDIITTPVRRKA